MFTLSTISMIVEVGRQCTLRLYTWQWNTMETTSRATTAHLDVTTRRRHWTHRWQFVEYCQWPWSLEGAIRPIAGQSVQWVSECNSEDHWAHWQVSQNWSPHISTLVILLSVDFIPSLKLSFCHFTIILSILLNISKLPVYTRSLHCRWHHRSCYCLWSLISMVWNSWYCT